jgi:transcriptional regulator with XRE-family HTH domain
MGLSLGQYVKSVRKSAKMSAAALSKEAGISKSYLDYIESGAREPKPDVLAKLAVSLNVPLEALIEMQNKDQLASAYNRLSAENTALTGDDLRAVARSGDDELTIDERALAMTQAAFQGASDPSKYADFIENADLRAIVKAGAKLTEEDLQKIRKIMESLYPNEFI